MPTPKNIDRDFFKKWNPHMAYVVGFLAADGNISVNKWGANYINIQIADKQLIYAIRKVLRSDHSISVRPQKDGNRTLYRLQIGSWEMCDDLRGIGIHEKKTEHLVLPQIPKEFLSHFVRGYFDGDGNTWSGLIHKERRTTHCTLQTAFTSCSKELLIDLKDVLQLTLNLKGSLIHLRRKTSNCYRLQYSRDDSLQLYKFMYNDSTLKLNRKYIQFGKNIKKMRE